jgi:hypothetical protein
LYVFVFLTSTMRKAESINIAEGLNSAGEGNDEVVLITHAKDALNISLNPSVTTPQNAVDHGLAAPPSMQA